MSARPATLSLHPQFRWIDTSGRVFYFLTRSAHTGHKSLSMSNKEVSQLNDGSAVTLTIAEGLSVTILTSQEHGWMMATKDVAAGYGVNPSTVRCHQTIHGDEIKEGVHYVTAVEIFNGGYKTRTTMWTKAGIVRLGFCIKSERAKMFRDWAEKVVLEKMSPRITAPSVELSRAVRRNHNRMTPARMVRILATVALVKDEQVRTSLVSQLMPDLSIPSLQLELPFGGKGGSDK